MDRETRSRITWYQYKMTLFRFFYGLKFLKYVTKGEKSAVEREETNEKNIFETIGKEESNLFWSKTLYS